MTFAKAPQNKKNPKRAQAPEIHLPTYILDRVPLAQIDPDPENPRARVSSSDVADLRESIRIHGLLSPLIVVDAPKGAPARFRLLCGHRRLRALLDLGQADAQAFRIEHGTGQALAGVLALVENGQRVPIDPVLEADRIAALVSRPGWNAVDVATQLGRSVGYVEERLALAGLSAKWREARSVPVYKASKLTEGVAVADWPMRWLREVALLDPAQQDELLAAWTRHPWSAPGDLENVRSHVRERLGSLDGAPFDLEVEEVAPGCPSCAKCSKHSLATPGLFEDLVKASDLKHALCRDSACFALKVAAGAAARVRAAKAKHGEKLVVLTNRLDDLTPGDEGSDSREIEGVRAIEHHQVVPAKKGDKGAVPAVRDYGAAAGVTWVRPVGRGSSSVDAASGRKPKKKTLADRRADLEKRRARWVVANAIGIVEDFVKGPPGLTLTDTATLEFVGAFGLDERSSSDLPEFRRSSGESRTLRRLNAAARSTTPGSTEHLARNRWIFETAVSCVVSRLGTVGRFSGWSEADGIEEGAALFELLGLGLAWRDLLERARVELPEPKSWAAQEAEIATKASTRTSTKGSTRASTKASNAPAAAKPKGKAGKRAKGKRAAAADVEADDGEEPQPGPAAPRRYELDRLAYSARLDACPACGQPVVWHRLESGADVSLDVYGRVIVEGAAGRTYFLERHSNLCTPLPPPF